MAKTDTKNAPLAEAPKKHVFANLPEGFDVNELVQVGGLTPIYSAKDAWENKFPDLIGFMKGIEQLPDVKKGKEIYTPFMIRINVTSATKAIVGKLEDREVVEVKAGEDILLPISGNLRTNAKLLNAARHSELYYLACFHVRGPKDLKNGLSEMWDYDVQLHPKAQKRAGTQFAMLSAPRPALGEGEVVDMTTGEIIPSVINRPQQASA